MSDDLTCTRCGGTGDASGGPCWYCGGKGHHRRTVTAEDVQAKWDSHWLAVINNELAVIGRAAWHAAHARAARIGTPEWRAEHAEREARRTGVDLDDREQGWW